GGRGRGGRPAPAPPGGHPAPQQKPRRQARPGPPRATVPAPHPATRRREGNHRPPAPAAPRGRAARNGTRRRSRSRPRAGNPPDGTRSGRRDHPRAATGGAAGTPGTAARWRHRPAGPPRTGHRSAAPRRPPGPRPEAARPAATVTAPRHRPPPSRRPTAPLPGPGCQTTRHQLSRCSFGHQGARKATPAGARAVQRHEPRLHPTAGSIDVVARLKEESEVPLRSHGSLSLNRALMAAGRVDRVQATPLPVNTGQTGLDPIFQGTTDFDLELSENRTLDGHIQELIYRPTLR